MKVRNETGTRSQPRTRHFELRCRAVEFFFDQAQDRPSTLPSMAFTLPLIAALLGGSLISQVPLQVQPYRGGSEEESTPEEVLPEAEGDSDDNDWLSGPSEAPEESALELQAPPPTPPPAFNKHRFKKPVVRPGLPRSLHIDSIEPIDR